MFNPYFVVLCPKLIHRAPCSINKVREAYKSDANKKKGSFKMHHDEGMPPGVSEKHAACEMSEVGDVISSTSVRD